MKADEYVQYSCTSGQADPAPQIEIGVTDQNGENVIVDMVTKVKTVEDVGFRVFFDISFEENIKRVNIECKAENEVGEATDKLTTQVQCKLCKF